MSKLNPEKTAELSMQLIAIAGDANGLNLMALKKAVKGDFAGAQQLMEQAKKQLTDIHKIHADILQKEAQGNDITINTLFIHAQDHFANALVYEDLTKYIINLYAEVSNLRQEIELKCHGK